MPRPTPAFLLLTLATVLQAQNAPRITSPTPSPMPVLSSYPDSPAGKLLKEVKDHACVVSRVEFLTDHIGPRLTGSESLRQAQRWAMAEMKKLGAEHIHEEAYEFGLSWARGQDSARLLSHNGLRFRVDQVAWSPGTKGTIQGDLMLLEARNLEELHAYKGKLRGRILLRSNPFDKRPPLPRRAGADLISYLAEQAAMTQFLRDEGALASLYMSHMKNGLDTTGGGAGRDPKRPALPAAYVPQEPYKMLLRQVACREPLRLELNLGGALSAKPVTAYNVVGEIRGTEKPQEVVIVGAHLDSWDLGTGATDNATGVSVCLEVLRAFQATGLKPKRTLRVVLFSGEEQGLLGSRAYVEAHKAELESIQAVLIHDLGTGMVKGFDLQNRENVRDLMALAIAPLQGLGVRELPLSAMNGTDHAPFDRAGVPAFAARQEAVDYFESTHHTQVDFPDHVLPDQLVQGAQAIAVTAWELLNMEVRLPHGIIVPPPHPPVDTTASKR